MIGRLIIPLEGQQNLPWDFFVLEAARGGVQVPRWVLAAIRGTVTARLGISTDLVMGNHIDKLADELPDQPERLLRVLLENVEQRLPDPKVDSFRLTDEALSTIRTRAVSSPDLIWDATLILLLDYTAAGFFACIEATLDDEEWDPRVAVAAMLFLQVMRSC